MVNAGKTLEDLRREIDAIDSELHALIKRRALLVDRIKDAKSREAVETIRPGREAAILRDLAARHDGRFPVEAVIRIWREIIAGITRMEMPSYSVAAYTTADDQRCWDLARDQFGSATPIAGFGAARDVMGEVMAGRATLGVLPWPQEGENDPWWTNMTGSVGLRVCYRLPFGPPGAARGNAGTIEALVVGRVVPDPSGDDRTLIVVETAEALSRAGLARLLDRCRLEGRPIVSRRNGVFFHLVETDGFVSEDDPRIAELGGLEAVAGAVVIGAYATPMAGDTGHGDSSASALAGTGDGGSGRGGATAGRVS